MKHFHFLLIAFLLIAALGTMQAPSSALAASTITVQTIDDETANNSLCSLREAITNANNDAPTFPNCVAGSGPDTIIFASGLNGNILLGSALPVLSDIDGLTINGGGSKIMVNGGNSFRVFEIGVGVPVTIQNLTIAYGSGNGGNIHNAGTLNLLSSTLIGGTGTFGGAVYNDFGTVSITNSTFTLNTADFGATLYNDTGTVNITNSTFNDNSISGGGTGILYNDGSMTVKNTIIADGNSASLCAGIPMNAASTNNLAEDGTCGPSFNVVTLTQLALGALADNGGSTQTFKLLPGSIAVNAASNSFCPATDQRGTGRPQGTVCDGGSFEAKISFSVSPTSLAFGTNVVGITTAPKTVTITNTGEADLVIDVITITTAIPGEFSIINDLCSSTAIAPAGTCTFAVTFTPTTAVGKTAIVSIPSNILVSPTNIGVNGTGSNGINLVKNPGFEYPYKPPLSWRSPQIAIRLNAALDCSTGLNSFCSLRLPGSGKLIYVAQEIRSGGFAGAKYLVKLSSKADLISLPGDGVYEGRIVFLDGYGKTLETFFLTFTPGTHDWEQFQTVIVTTKKFFTINFRIYLKSNGGTAWFDNAALIRLP